MGEWKTIDSAPKDGTRILVHECGDIVIAHWGLRGYAQWNGPRDSYGEVEEMFPDLWMPLPPPPTADR